MISRPLSRRTDEACIRCGMRMCNRDRAMWPVNWAVEGEEGAEKEAIRSSGHE